MFGGMALVKLQQVSLFWLGGDGLFYSFCLRQCPQFPMDCYWVTLFIALAPSQASHVSSQQYYTAHLFSCFLSPLSFSQTHLRCSAIRGDYVHPWEGISCSSSRFLHGHFLYSYDIIQRPFLCNSSEVQILIIPRGLWHAGSVTSPSATAEYD